MENNAGVIEISQDMKVLKVTQAMIDHSAFRDISAKYMKITDANLSDLEIEGAQIGGAFIHNIGMPPEGHAMYDPGARQRPVRFENCDLNNSNFINCDLENLVIDNCNIAGMTLNGIPVTDLLNAYERRQAS